MRFLLVLAALAIAAPAFAQSLWLDRQHRPSVLGEVLFPSYQLTDTQFPTWAWLVSGKLPIGDDGTSLVLELPYAHGDFGEGPGNSGGSIGNPYIGIDYQPKPSGLILEAGVRLPLESDSDFIPFVVGTASDIDRMEAFWPHLIPIRIGFHYHHEPASSKSPIAWDLRAVPTVWIPSEGGGDSELLLGYGGYLRYMGEQVRVGGGLGGRWDATADNSDFAESSWHQLDLEADFLKGKVRPGLQFKAPLDDGVITSSNFAWGFTLTVLP